MSFLSYIKEIVPIVFDCKCFWGHGCVTVVCSVGNAIWSSLIFMWADKGHISNQSWSIYKYNKMSSPLSVRTQTILQSDVSVEEVIRKLFFSVIIRHVFLLIFYDWTTLVFPLLSGFTLLQESFLLRWYFCRLLLLVSLWLAQTWGCKFVSNSFVLTEVRSGWSGSCGKNRLSWSACMRVVCATCLYLSCYVSCKEKPQGRARMAFGRISDKLKCDYFLMDESLTDYQRKVKFLKIMLGIYF